MKHCILVAGLPASGKTTFAAHLSSQLHLPMISKDRLKELLYNTIGFHSSAEKVTLSIASTQILYYYAETLMRAGQSFILENNFENVQKPQLQSLLQQYQYQPLTIRFGGDVRVIYERYTARENTAERHKGHSTATAYPQPQNVGFFSTSSLSFQDFMAGIEARGIHNFSVGGSEIVVDATNFAQVHYAEIVQHVRDTLQSSLF